MSENFSLNFNGKDYLIKKNDVKDDTKLSKEDLGIQKGSIEESIFDEMQLAKGANGVGGDNSIFDAGEIKTFINSLDGMDTNNNNKLTDYEIYNFMKANNISQDEPRDEQIKAFKNFFSSITSAIDKSDASNNTNPSSEADNTPSLQYDSSKPGILKDTEDTNRPDDVYVEIQEWGSDPLDGNKSANDCLSRVIANYYGVTMGDPEYEAIEKAIMDYNPEIYGGEGQGIEDAGKNYNVRGTAVNDNSVYPTGEDRHNAILYSEEYNPLREDGGADRIYLPDEIKTSSLKQEELNNSSSEIEDNEENTLKQWQNKVTDYENRLANLPENDPQRTSLEKSLTIAYKNIKQLDNTLKQWQNNITNYENQLDNLPENDPQRTSLEKSLTIAYKNYNQRCKELGLQ